MQPILFHKYTPQAQAQLNILNVTFFSFFSDIFLIHF